MKYLFKYHFKGKDLVTVEGVNKNDKIVTFTLQQYIGAFKAYLANCRVQSSENQTKHNGAAS